MNEVVNLFGETVRSPDSSRRAKKRAAHARYRARNRELLRQKDKDRAKRPGTRERKRRDQRRCRARHPEINLRERLRRYGLTLQQFKQMLAAQSNCPICGVDFQNLRRRPVVDHDHKTGAIRSLLCSRCNTFLAFVENAPHLIETARRYLASYTDGTADA